MLADQMTKELARQHLTTYKGVATSYGVFKLKYAENTGVFSSLGVGFSDDVKFWLFTVAIAVVLCFLLGYLLINKLLTTSSIIGYSLILAGGASNVIDRVVNEGAVVDFMYISLAGMRTNIFNIADMAITLGIIWLSLSLLIKLTRREKAELNR
jgi:signal peptidase II